MADLIESLADVRRVTSEARAAGRCVGLVPTMGGLHEGHARLIEHCREEVGGGLVVVSVFVNPTQFGPQEDFARYPRTLEADMVLCRAAGADVVFAPAAAAMYPRPAAAMSYVEVPGLSDVLEGAARPGHFRGVATVVLKLFSIVGPDLAHFGAKDFQQQLVIRRMVEDLDLAVAVRVVPTVREADGLALSSRNRFLGPEDRRAATVLSRALERARGAVAGGERDADRVRQLLRSAIECERAARLDYAEVADAETLAPLARLGQGRPAVALVAARLGTTRLIDNALLTEAPGHEAQSPEVQAAHGDGDARRPELPR